MMCVQAIWKALARIGPHTIHDNVAAVTRLRLRLHAKITATWLCSRPRAAKATQLDYSTATATRLRNYTATRLGQTV